MPQVGWFSGASCRETVWGWVEYDHEEFNRSLMEQFCILTEAEVIQINVCDKME